MRLGWPWKGHWDAEHGAANSTGRVPLVAAAGDDGERGEAARPRAAGIGKLAGTAESERKGRRGTGSHSPPREASGPVLASGDAVVGEIDAGGRSLMRWRRSALGSLDCS